MKTLLMIMCVCVSVWANNVPRHTTVYHDTTVTQQLSIIETENGYIRQIETHHEVTKPKDRRRLKVISRVFTFATGCVMIGLSTNASAKANEYKELQGVSNFYSNAGYSGSVTDYKHEIDRYEQQHAMYLGIGGSAFALFGLTFVF